MIDNLTVDTPGWVSSFGASGGGIIILAVLGLIVLVLWLGLFSDIGQLVKKCLKARK